MPDKTPRQSSNKSKTTSDRRARKTRDALAGAIIGLAQEKRLDDIKPSELSRKAKIGRSTFYAHFAGKEDYLAASFADLIGRMDAAEAAKNKAMYLFPSSMYLKHAAAAKAYAHALVQSKSYPVIRQKNELAVRKIIARNLARLPRASERTSARLDVLLSGAFMSLAYQWMSNGLKEPPEVIDEAFQNLCHAVLAAQAATKLR